MKKLTTILMLELVKARQDYNFDLPVALREPWYFACHALDADCGPPDIPEKEKNGGKYRIIMIGDSQARGNSQYGFFSSNIIFDIGEMILKDKGYKYEDKIEVINFAVSRRGVLATGVAPFTKDPNWKHVLESKPDAVVLMLGANDAKKKQWTNERQFKKDYINMVNELLKVVPSKEHLYIISSPPALPDYHEQHECQFDNHVMNDIMPPLFPEILKSVGLNEAHNFVSTYELFDGGADSAAEWYYKEGFFLEEEQFDRCHPNVGAHQLIAQKLYPKMLPQLDAVLDGKVAPNGYKEKWPQTLPHSEVKQSRDKPRQVIHLSKDQKRNVTK